MYAVEIISPLNLNEALGRRDNVLVSGNRKMPDRFVNGADT
jgi:hypothetical protein